MCDDDKKCCCCCEGPQGIPGPQGIEGPRGVQGVKGDAGERGDAGPQGNQGIQGSKGDPGQQGSQGIQGEVGQQGVQGIQGPMGPKCECNIPFGCCDKAWVSLYSLQNQTIPSLSAATFELLSEMSPGDFDISNAAITGEIVCLNHGFYLLNWGFDGLLAPPYPFPVPAWGLGIYLNGVVQLGTTSGSCSISPDDICTHTSAEDIIELKVGDVIKLVNICSQAVNAVTIPFGIVGQIAAARINLVMIEKLP